jgi:hypothetical protein
MSSLDHPYLYLRWVNLIITERLQVLAYRAANRLP